MYLQSLQKWRVDLNRQIISMVVPQIVVMTFGIAYIVLRVLYGICYLANLATLRSVIWMLSLLCPICLLIMVIKLT